MTVQENITYALRVHKLDRAELQTRLHSVLEILGLEPYAQRKPPGALRRPAAAGGPWPGRW